MTGWRLGWMMVPEDLLRAVECLAQNLFISPPTLSQIAGVAAFGCREELDANVARYAENRALLLRELPAAGFDDLAPADGAFYLYADVSRWTNDSEAFRSEEHTSELQSLMRISYAVFCLKNKTTTQEKHHRVTQITYTNNTDQ